MQNETILYYMTISYRELKNVEMATLYGKKTIEAGISPNTALYYSLLGGVYEQRNQFLTAAINYKRGLTFSDYKTIFYRLALVYDYNLKQPKTALSYYQQYVKSNPDNDEKKQVDFAKSRIIEMTQAKSSKVGLTSSQN